MTATVLSLDPALLQAFRQLRKRAVKIVKPQPLQRQAC